MIERHQFIPDTIWIDDADGWMRQLRRIDDPDRWFAICESNAAIVTQVDDGAPVNGKGLRPSSSSSAPITMYSMIDELDLRSGMRVLEIGTGTGYNAALLAAAVGTENVVTVELDRQIADHARKALAAAGYPVETVIGDGLRGYPPRAPYDRVIVTAAASEVPNEWIAQTRPGGRVLLPWKPYFSPSGALLSLVVSADGTAEGRFGETVAFMCLRGQRPRFVSWVDDEFAGDYVETKTSMTPPVDAFFGDPDTGFAVGVKLPGIVPGKTLDEDGVQTLRLADPGSGSWAACVPGNGEHTVRQHGPRLLWDEFEAAYQWWTRQGRPDHTRFGMTVTADGQRVWLDSPDQPMPAPYW